MSSHGVPGSGGRRLLLGIAVLALAAALPARAQFHRPAEVPLPLPPFAEPQEGAGELVLPPVPPPRPIAPSSDALRVAVRSFRFRGQTVFGEAELEAVVAPWTGRELTGAELRAARDAVTQVYLDAGYVDSGAVLPDQPVRDGVVELVIVEGVLTDVVVEGTQWFRKSYIARRLRAGAGKPLSSDSLERAIRLLQEDPAIARIDARLEPGAQRGEAILRVKVTEEMPIGLVVGADDYEAPSVGEYAGFVIATDDNLLGLADRLGFEGRFTEGVVDVAGGYELPVTPWDTRLGAAGRWTRSKVVEGDFEDLDIEVESSTVGLAVRQPIWRTPNAELIGGLLGEWRNSNTQVGGIPFDFPGSGSRNGDATLAVLRFVGEGSLRSTEQVLAARSLLSWGLETLGATTSPDAPDGRYVAWLLQLQWVRRFDTPWLPVSVGLRGDLQLTNDALIAFERFPIGGRFSVRGYRENQIVRDQGVFGSIEVRVPVWRESVTGRTLVELAPFVDVGRGWDQNRGRRHTETLTGAGIGLRFHPFSFLYGEFYWGYSFDDVPTHGSLQDHGIYFRVGAVAF